MTSTAVPPPPQRPRSWYKRNAISLTPWLFLIPAILFFLLYVVFPIIQSLQLSAFQWDGPDEKE